jgi:hypothetical protein
MLSVYNYMASGVLLTASSRCCLQTAAWPNSPDGPGLLKYLIMFAPLGS